MPHTKLVITSYSYVKSEDGSIGGGGAPGGDNSINGKSHDSGTRARTRKIVESSVGNEESITIVDDEDAMGDQDDDDLTIDSAMQIRTESANFAHTKCNNKYEGKAYPGYLKLRSDLETENPESREAKAEYELSLNYPAVVNSSHTMSGKMALRRGQTGSNYYEGLAMNELMRATSPVSGPVERLRIRGFKEPPRDYVQNHKLTPIDKKLELKRYGYGKSPKAKNEALNDVINKRYSDRNLATLQVVESPLNSAQVKATIHIPLLPGSPKSQFQEAREKEKADEQKKVAESEKRQRRLTAKSMKRNAKKSLNLNNSRPLGAVQGMSDSMQGSAIDDLGSIGSGEDSSVLSDHENFDLDAHMNNALEEIGLERGFTTTTTGAGTPKLDLNSSVGLLDGSLEDGVYDTSLTFGDDPNMMTNTTDGGSQHTANTKDSKAKAMLGDLVEEQLMSLSQTAELSGTEEQAAAASTEGDGSDIGLAGVGRDTTGQALSLGSGSRLQGESSSLKIKSTPAQRKRMKIQAEKQALAKSGQKHQIVVAARGRNVDYFRLKNPSKTSASGRDPRPGALQPFSDPYYHPKSYRLPESLEDKLNNMTNQEDEDDKHLSEFMATEQSVDSMDQLPSAENRDPHAWRRNFLGGKKIKFLDALDTDSENENGLDDAEDDFDFSLAGSSAGGDGGDDDDDDDDGDNDDGQGSRGGSQGRNSARTPGSGKRSSASAGGGDMAAALDQDSLLTTSLAESMGHEGGDTDIGGSPPQLKVEPAQALPPPNDEKNGREFIPINTSDDYFPGASPDLEENRSASSLGKKTKEPFFSAAEGLNQQQQQLTDPTGSVGDGEGRSIDPGSPTLSVSRGLSATVSMARASIDDVPTGAVPPGTNYNDKGTSSSSLSQHTPGGSINHAGAGAGAGFGVVSTAGSRGVPTPTATAAAAAADGSGEGPAAAMVTGGVLDNNSQNGGDGSKLSGESGFKLPSSVIESGDDAGSVGSQSTSISKKMNARELMRQKAEQDELRKKRQKERAIAKLRAKKLMALQEAQSKKTMQFIQNHADPVTAKRTDYSFPEHGIQKPGVGEARLRHRDYAYDSMYIHPDGSLRSQKDEHNSTLLDTALLDVRLRTPVSGGNGDNRPLSPWEREARQTDHMMKYTFTGSFPSTPEISHRKISHQLQILEDDLRQNQHFSADPVFHYDGTVTLGKPDENDMSKPDFTTASQRFREEAEFRRKVRESEQLEEARERAAKQEEADNALLAAAGIKKPKRKKLQKAKKEVQAEPLPVAYSVGPSSTGGVSASIVPTRAPSHVRKPKLRFTKEVTAADALAGESCAPVVKFGKTHDQASLSLPEVTPIKKRSATRKGAKKGDGDSPPPEGGDKNEEKEKKAAAAAVQWNRGETGMKISGGVTIFTRDNRAVDPEGYARKEWETQAKEKSEANHSIWGSADAATAVLTKEQIAENLKRAALIASITDRSDQGSADASRGGGSRGSRRFSTFLTPPGSAGSSVTKNQAHYNNGEGSPGSVPGQGSPGVGNESMSISLHSAAGGAPALEAFEEDDNDSV
jgi:hypothetical protein